ncbi:MAG: ABC transporter substrate-binding protein [Flavobacteriales bacterium]
MRRRILGIAIVFLFTACGGSGGDQEGSQKKAEGPVNYGGVFKLNEVEDFDDLYPLNITDAVSNRIASQVYEGLVEVSQDTLKIQPALAKSWEIKDSATRYVFHLREDVKFHKNKCFDKGSERKLTAKDVKYCFDKLCSSSPRNQLFWLFKNKVKGANKYFKSTEKGKPLKNGVPGIRVKGKHTIELKLNYPYKGFLKILAHAGCFIYPKKAFDHYQKKFRVNPVGTGPFKMQRVEKGVSVVLKRNGEYWDKDQYGNKLPYLDGIKITFKKEKTQELTAFHNDNLDMVYRLPVASIDKITEDLEQAKKKKKKELPFKLQDKPSMAVQYYGFQHKSDLFSSKHLRKAFNYAINREKLTKFTLEGEGIPAHNGIIPPSFENYPSDKVKGYSLNVKKAKEHLKKARGHLKELGYKNGELPTINLYLNSGGSKNVVVAEAIQNMWNKHLGIQVQLNEMPLSQLLEKMEKGKAGIFRTGWIADYPDPENFLNLFYGKHVPESMDERSSINKTRYDSAKFDSLFAKGLRTLDNKKRMKLFRLAEQEAMDDAAVIPLFYDENMRLIKPDVRNFPMNPMERRDFTRVYFAKEKKKEEEKKES